MPRVIAQKWETKTLAGKPVKDSSDGWSIHKSEVGCLAFVKALVTKLEAYNSKHLQNPKHAENSGYTKDLKKNITTERCVGEMFGLEVSDEVFAELADSNSSKNIFGLEYLWLSSVEPVTLTREDLGFTFQPAKSV